MSFVGFAAVITLMVIVLLFLTVPEALTGWSAFGQLPVAGGRLGLIRARGSLEHPILHGIFCASATGLSWYALSGGSTRVSLGRLIRGFTVFGAAFTSVSSGALVALAVQYILIGWDHVSRAVPYRWRVFGCLCALGYGAIELVSNRPAPHVLLQYLTFSAETAYYRILIWRYGFYDNVLQHPVFGIGMSDWVRPSWMASTSMDNFWLVLMCQNGLPCFIFVYAAIADLLMRGYRGAAARGVVPVYKAWAVTVGGMVIAAWTVHLWNAIFVYFFFLLGAGAYFGATRQ